MSNNFYNNFDRTTFQNACVPPPPMPPSFFLPPVHSRQENDQNFIKKFENLPMAVKPRVKPNISINKVRDELHMLIRALNKMKEKEKMLSKNVNNLSEEEWSVNMMDINEKKNEINFLLSSINNLNLEVFKKLLAKRAAKRMRLKRLRAERKREKEERIKQMKEQSRKIDENLQKIKDDINKAKQEEEAKTQADLVLKETLRKKSDAKKCIVKLDALSKLRKARQNTAKGRGETVSDNEAAVFDSNIEKLKSLWSQRLSLYEKEESELRQKLKQDSNTDRSDATNECERDKNNLEEWKRVMFGGQLPQVDFKGDLTRFVVVRGQWDKFIDNEGSPIPIGWLVPTEIYSQ